MLRPHPPLAWLLLVCPLVCLGALAPPPAPPAEDEEKELTAQPQLAPTVLAGRITDERGNPVPNVKVLLYNGVATRWLGQETQTAPDGTYRFDPLETGAITAPHDGNPGAYHVGIRLEHPDLVSADGSNWWDIDVPFSTTARKDFTLTPGARITGSITDHRGYRWGDFHIRLVPTDEESQIGAYYAATDHMGRFEVAEAIYPGRYEVQWNEPHASFTVLATITLAPRTTTTLAIPLRLTAEPQEPKVEVQPSAPSNGAPAD
jgi:protocatechuate 3,4-dioxygenase beta subunit